MQSSARAALEHLANLLRENWRHFAYGVSCGLGIALAALNRCQYETVDFAR